MIVPNLTIKWRHLYKLASLARSRHFGFRLSVNIALVSSSDRGTSVKLNISRSRRERVTYKPKDRAPGLPGPDQKRMALGPMIGNHWEALLPMVVWLKTIEKAIDFIFFCKNQKPKIIDHRSGLITIVANVKIWKKCGIRRRWGKSLVAREPEARYISGSKHTSGTLHWSVFRTRASCLAALPPCRLATLPPCYLAQLYHHPSLIVQLSCLPPFSPHLSTSLSVSRTSAPPPPYNKVSLTSPFSPAIHTSSPMNSWHMDFCIDWQSVGKVRKGFAKM